MPSILHFKNVNDLIVGHGSDTNCNKLFLGNKYLMLCGVFPMSYTLLAQLC